VVGVALIAAFACPAQPAVLVDRRPGEVRTRVVACDGDRRVVVRRARLRRGRAGSRVTDAAAAGRRVAWAELRYAGGRVSGIVASRWIDGRAVRRYVVRRPRRAAPRAFEVVVTTRGDLAWLIGRRVQVAEYLDDGFPFFEAEHARGPLRLEDDSTAYWRTREGLGFHDMFRTRGSGCPARSRFRPLTESEHVVVSTADYAAGEGGVRVIRACLRSWPTDPVIAQAHSDDDLAVLALSGEWVVLSRAVGGCEVAVEVHNARGYPGRGADPIPCERAPSAATPLVVSSNGAPVWVVDEPQRSVVLTPAGTGMIELDSTGRGGITGLAADGDAVRWLHDGTPRSVRFP
jgi:hypothetical protein